MASREPDEIDRNSIGDEDVEWDDNVIKDLHIRFEELSQYSRNLKKSCNEVTREEVSTFADSTRHDIEELIANQIYDKLTILLNKTRKNFGIKKGRPIEPIKNYDNFELADDGTITYVYKRMVIDLGNINERLIPP